MKAIAYVGSEATAKDPAGSFLVCEGRLDPAKGFELSFRIQDEDKVHVPGAKNADFVDMVTGLGRSQDGLDDDAVIAKHLLRGMIVPFDFYEDDSFRIPGFHLQKSTPYTTYDEDRRMEVTAGTDLQGLSCGDSQSSSPRAPCVTPDSPPHKDAAR